MKPSIKPSRFTAHAVLTGILALCFGGLAQNFGVAPPAIAQPPANHRLGIDFIGVAGFVDVPVMPDRQAEATEAGATWDRWVFYWDKIETAPDHFDYTAHDTRVIADRAAGLQIDGVLMITPPFYASGGSLLAQAPRLHDRPLPTRALARSADETIQQTCNVAIGSGTLPPRNLDQPVFVDGPDGRYINRQNYWAYFVWKTVERYDGDGVDDAPADPETGVKPVAKHWEMWNEPDFPCHDNFGGFWNGTPANYYRLLQVGYLAAKHADPEATVVLGGLAHWPYPGQDWFQEFLDAAAADPDEEQQAQNNDYFDALALHWYSNVRNTLISQEYAAQMTSRGLGDKVIWINESGVPSWEDYPGNGNPETPYQASLEEQAAYVLQNIAYALASELSTPKIPTERVFHFQLYDDGRGEAYGLIRNPSDGSLDPHPTQPGQSRPAYDAFTTAARYLHDDVIPLWHTESSDGLARIAFFHPPDRRTLVLWNWNASTKSWQVARTGPEGLLIDEIGHSTSITPTGATYNIELPGATNFNQPETPGVPMIGGAPRILIETDVLTPTAQVNPLPESSPPNFQVAWDLQDWGTGIAAYEIWYSDGVPESTESWKLWIENPVAGPIRGRLQGSAEFAGQLGHTYYFAARAQDQAGNWSVLGEPQSWTTVRENGTIAGRVFDIRTQPIASATVQVILETGDVIATDMTDADGRFIVDDIPFGAEYGVSALADGYGRWAPHWGVTPMSTVTSSVEMYLPPFANAITNGDFEEDDGLAGWVTNGDTPPIRSHYWQQTGESSALIGFRNDETAPGDSILSQVIDVPAETPALGFWYRVARTKGTDDLEPNLFQVLLTTGESHEPRELYVDHLSASEAWRYQWVDVSAFAGQEVKLTFKLIQPSADLQTVVYLDNVALGASTRQEGLWREVFLPVLMRNWP